MHAAAGIREIAWCSLWISLWHCVACAVRLQQQTVWLPPLEPHHHIILDIVVNTS
jgi:hypothetical protein